MFLLFKWTRIVFKLTFGRNKKALSLPKFKNYERQTNFHNIIYYNSYSDYTAQFNQCLLFIEFNNNRSDNRDRRDRHHPKKTNYSQKLPIIGNFRYMLEKVRPEIMQYFVETDTEGKPINRLYRSVIYQRAKKETSTSPFGTQWDVYRSGYEWIDHSIYAANPADLEQEQRILVGEKIA